MKEKKKALAVVAGPYRFYQVLWLYSQFQEYEWNILILPYGEGDKNAKQIEAHCEKLGIFKNIYHSHMTGQNSSPLEQVAIILKMFVYYTVGQKKRLMRKIISEQTNGLEFDVAFVGCEYSIIEGAIIGLADEIEVNIFEEGLGDYVPKKKYPALKPIELISYFISKMGYFSPYQYFELKNSKKCIKYATLPKLMKNRQYREIRQSFQTDSEKRKMHKSILEKLYDVDTSVFEKIDVVLFTLPLNGYVVNGEDDKQRMYKWLVEKYGNKNILIKKHPRDEEKYEWEDLNISFLDEKFPAETIVEYIADQDIVMMGMSTVLLSFLQRLKNVSILQFHDILDIYEEIEKKSIKVLNISNDKIIEL